MLPKRKYMNEKPVEPGKLNKGVGYSHHARFSKLDGIHVIVTVAITGTVAVQSRTGEPLPSMQPAAVSHVSAGHFQAGSVYFCEAWSPIRSFPEISGIVRRQSEAAPPDVELYPFDTVTLAEWYQEWSHRPWLERTNALRRDYPLALSHGLTIMPALQDGPIGEVLALVVRKADMPGPVDGIIHRNIEATWESKPATQGNVVKAKPRPVYDLKCIGTTEGKGQFVGMVGALVFQTGKNVTCEAGTGLSKEDRGLDPSEFVGKVFMVSALGVNKSGKLREPAILGYVFDKTEGQLPADEGEE